MSCAKIFRQLALVAILAVCAIAQQAKENKQDWEKVPIVNAELGPCWAEFTVTDSDNKPVYNATVRVQVKHGFMSARKMDLEVGTNSAGKARVEGLPHDVKKPLVFEVNRDSAFQTIHHDPASNCHLFQDVVLKAEPK